MFIISGPLRFIETNLRSRSFKMVCEESHSSIYFEVGKSLRVLIAGPLKLFWGKEREPHSFRDPTACFRRHQCRDLRQIVHIGHADLIASGPVEGFQHPPEQSGCHDVPRWQILVGRPARIPRTRWSWQLSVH